MSIAKKVNKVKEMSADIQKDLEYDEKQISALLEDLRRVNK